MGEALGIILVVIGAIVGFISLAFFIAYSIDLIIDNRWRRRRRFRRLKAEFKNYDRYEIYRSETLFGFDFFRPGYKSSYTPLASSPEQALKRYFNWYRRVFKEEADRFNREHWPTDSEWGFYKVVNLRTGFKTYLK